MIEPICECVCYLSFVTIVDTVESIL